MSTVQWLLGTQGSNILSTTADSLSNGSTSAFVEHDNSTTLYPYAFVTVVLGSITTASGASLTLRAYPTAGATPDVPDDIGSVGGGEAYTQPVKVGTAAKTHVFRIQLPPGKVKLQLTNNTGVSLAASGNSLKVQPYTEQIT